MCYSPEPGFVGDGSVHSGIVNFPRVLMTLWQILYVYTLKLASS